MLPTISTLLGLGLYTCAALAQASDPCDYEDPNWTNPCVSWGVDFQPGGVYFQNINSTDDFTFVSEFEGCQSDAFAQNVLVDDQSGSQVQCSNTNMTPDDTDELSTCPIEKDHLYTGDWSLLILSNNGVNGCPIAYERDFSLIVGSQVTTTFTPTVTLSVTSTPITTVTSTQTYTDSETTTSIVTSPAKTLKPTTTVTPQKVTTTKTITMATYKKTAWTAVPTLITKTVTMSCSIPPRQPHPDPTCTITPTVVSAAATIAAVRRRDEGLHRISWPIKHEERIAAKKARRARAAPIEERGLDQPTVTVTDTNTSMYPTSTTVTYAATSTLSITTLATTTVWTTTTSTVYSGTTVLSQVTITAPTPTKTKTRYTVVTSTVATVTKHPTITITVHTAPVQSTAACEARGGKMW